MTAVESEAEALSIVSDVEGWLTDDQVVRLWNAARQTRRGDHIVEIGSFRARSTIVLARGAPLGVDITAIDPHAGNDRGPREIDPAASRGSDDHEAFHANLQRAGVSDRVRHVRAYSTDAHDEVTSTIELLHIDGAHRFKPALDDIRRWGARVTPGGTMFVHDGFNAVGVVLAQALVLSCSGRFRYVGRTDSLVEYRAERLGVVGRLRNLGLHLAQVPYTALNQFVKVLIVCRLGRLTRFLGRPAGVWPI